MILYSYETYIKQIEGLLLHNPHNTTELDYRYSKKCERENKPNDNSSVSEIDKMRFIGKIGYTPTALVMNPNTPQEKQLLRFESLEGFGSLHANNCVISGKWCFETQIITNGLFQIGWCQLLTPFTHTNGVGDDLTSYAVDGWRKVKWHQNFDVYGELWDVGDIIGSCIDLDNQTIEFFLNGKPLGKAYDSIPVGKNIAYFPGVSQSKSEICSFNFGQSPFQYVYQGYEPLDYPMSEINGSLEKTAKVLELLRSHLLNICQSKNIRMYEKMLICQLPFNYLAYISFFDIYLWKTILLPFLYDLSIKSIAQFNSLFELLLIQLNTPEKKKEFVSMIFSSITNLIEEYSLIGEAGQSDWTRLISLLISLINIDCIVYIWADCGIIKNLKSIFNTNCIHMNNYYKYIEEKFGIKSCNIQVSKMLKEVKQDYVCKKEERNNKIEKVYSEYLSQLIFIILTDKRCFPQNKTFKDIFNELMKTSYGFGYIQEIIIDLLESQERMKKDKRIFLKNIFYNLLYVFNKKYLSLPFDQITTYPWFNRNEQDSIYFDEVGIGGTISHVSSEYINQIDEAIIKSSDDFCFDFFHKVVRISNDLFTKLLVQIFEQDRNSYKELTISQIANFSNGSKNFDYAFRSHFYLFPYHTEIIFYQFSFFLIKYLTYLKNLNDKIIYFIPNCVIELPFAFFKILILLKSRIFFNKDERNKINATSINFKSDDYIQLIINFYLYLFSDNTILNPEIRENLLLKVNFFLKNKELINYFENEYALESLIKGLLNNINSDSRSLYASKILLKIITPICFGHEKQSKRNLILLNVKKYFVNHFSLFNDFLINYSKFANQIMTDYTIHLSVVNDKLPFNNSNEEKTQLNIALQEVYASYTSMCGLLKIYEFFIFIFPDEFMNPESLVCIQFINILNNLSLRILIEPYLGILIKISDNINDILGNNKREINLLDLCYSVFGLIIKISNSKNNKHYGVFIKKLANLPGFSIKAFEDFSLNIMIKIKDERIEKDIKHFFSVLKEMKDLIETKVLTEKELDKLVAEDKICVLCYVNMANMELLPCKHSKLIIFLLCFYLRGLL